MLPPGAGFVLVICAAMVAACPVEAPAPGSLTFACRASDECAPGFVCVDGHCGNGDSADAGAVDALGTDRSASDSQALDSRAPDSSATDSSAPDSGAPDSSAPDSSAADVSAPDAATRVRYALEVVNPTAEAQSDLPVMLRLTPARVDYGFCGSAGEHLEIIDNVDSAVLAIEIERWVEAGDSTVWVHLPLLPTSDRARLWLRCDPAIEGPGNRRGVEVWQRGYVGVFHFSEQPSGATGELRDSTGIGHATSHGGMSAQDQVQGQAAGGLSFDGADDYLFAPGLDAPEAAFTYSVWFNPAADVAAPGPRQDIFYWGGGGRPHLTINREDDGAIGLYTHVGDIFFDDNKTTGSSWSAGSWHHLAFTFDGAEQRVYVDGLADGPARPLAGAHSAASSLFVASTSGPSTFYAGALDELRISGVARSASWLRVQDASLRDQLVSYGRGEPY